MISGSKDDDDEAIPLQEIAIIKHIELKSNNMKINDVAAIFRK